MSRTMYDATTSFSKPSPVVPLDADRLLFSPVDCVKLAVGDPAFVATPCEVTGLARWLDAARSAPLTRVALRDAFPAGRYHLSAAIGGPAVVSADELAAAAVALLTRLDLAARRRLSKFGFAFDAGLSAVRYAASPLNN